MLALMHPNITLQACKGPSCAETFHQICLKANCLTHRDCNIPIEIACLVEAVDIIKLVLCTVGLTSAE